MLRGLNVTETEFNQSLKTELELSGKRVEKVERIWPLLFFILELQLKYRSIFDRKNLLIAKLSRIVKK